MNTLTKRIKNGNDVRSNKNKSLVMICFIYSEEEDLLTQRHLVDSHCYSLVIYLALLNVSVLLSLSSTFSCQSLRIF